MAPEQTDADPPAPEAPKGSFATVLAFARDHLQVGLAIFAALGFLYSIGLVVVEQHTYGLLGLRPEEVGIDRGRLLDEVGPATVLVVLAVAMIMLIASAAFVAGNRSRGWRRRWLLIGLGLCAFVAPAVTFAAEWRVGSDIAKEVRAGHATNGFVFAGLRIIDVDAGWFRFTKLPVRRTFDPGCMLYLGRADGDRVMYDVEDGVALSLDEDEYRGEAAVATGHGVRLRCGFHAAKGDRRIADPDVVEDVDAAGGTVVWSAKSAGDPWGLYINTVTGPRLLTRSVRRLEPDLGRDANGHLVVTYRSCTRTSCWLRMRRLSNAMHSIGLSFPVRPHCFTDSPVLATRVVAVAVRGRQCPSTDRGVWTRRPSGVWHRVTGSGLVVAGLDAMGSRVAWVERRGDYRRLRVLADGEARTIDTVDRDVGSLRLTNAGAMWTMRAPRKDASVLSVHRWDGHACARDVYVPAGVDNVAHVAPLGSRLVVARRSAVLTRAASDKAFAAARRCFED